MDEKIYLKLLKKLQGFTPKVEFLDHGTIKKAFVKKAFQVSGKLYSIELAYVTRLMIEGGDFYSTHEFYLVRYNSRSTEGGYTYRTVDDIANNLGLKKEEANGLINNLGVLSKFTEKDVVKAKNFYLKQIEKSARKIERTAKKVAAA